MEVTADELARVTQFLAKQAHTFAMQAGVGSMETAGGFVSFLACHPDKCEAYLADPLGTLPAIPDPFWVHGCLSWHSSSGEIVTPAQVRQARGLEQ